MVQKLLGGELVLPRLMGQRLREILAAVAANSKGTLLERIAPELRKARLGYTDYVEEDDDGLGAYCIRAVSPSNENGWYDTENEEYSTAAINDD